MITFADDNDVQCNLPPWSSALQAKVLDNAANMGSPRLLAATHLGSPKAGAQLLHPTSTSAPDGPAASGSQLPGIHASDIASILGMNLTPTAGAAGSALRGSLVGLPTGGSTGGLGGPQTSFDPSSLVAPILTKPGSSPANGGAAAQGAGEPAAAGPAPLSAPGSALLRGGGVPGASPLGHGAGPSGLGSLLPMSQPGSATTTSAWAALQSPLAMLGGPDLGLPQGGASGTPLLDNDFLTNSFRTTEPDMPALEQMFATLDSLPAGARGQRVRRVLVWSRVSMCLAVVIMEALYCLSMRAPPPVSTSSLSPRHVRLWLKLSGS